MNLHLPSLARTGHRSPRVLILLRQSVGILAATATVPTVDEYPDFVLAGARIRIPFTAGNRVCSGASIASASERVANREVELVIVTDLSRISRSSREVADFVSQCGDYNIRLVSLDGSFDSAHENWNQVLADGLANVNFPTTEGGA